MESIDQQIARRAAQQHGTITTAQLREIGLDSATISRRAASGRLHRVHPHTYAVGHPTLSRQGQFMAASLALGEDAAISRRSSLELWGVRRFHIRAIEVVTPHRRRDLVGVRVRQTRRLDGSDIGVVDGIPVTTMNRTVIDLGEVLDERRIAWVINESVYLDILDIHRLEHDLRRWRNRSGIQSVRAALDRYRGGSAGTRSGLEDAFVEILSSAGVAAAELNVALNVAGGAPIEVDALWRAQRVCAEIDGPGHARPTVQRADRAKELRLQQAGYVVLRFTRDRIHGDAIGVVADVQRALLNGMPGPSALAVAMRR